jgi:CRISPR-associated protein (TIGR03984 family)
MKLVQDLKPEGTEWLAVSRPDVSDRHAVALVQGYPATGFWVLAADGRLLTPPAQEMSLDWNLYWDLRLFGAHGEWHFWREDSGNWAGRFCSRDEWSDYIDRQDALWGTRVETKEKDGWQWSRVWEERGVSVWVPFPVTAQSLPIRLTIRRRVDYQRHTALAGFVDAMLLGFSGVKL